MLEELNYICLPYLLDRIFDVSILRLLLFNRFHLIKTIDALVLTRKNILFN